MPCSPRSTVTIINQTPNSLLSVPVLLTLYILFIFFKGNLKTECSKSRRSCERQLRIVVSGRILKLLTLMSIPLAVQLND